MYKGKPNEEGAVMELYLVASVRENTLTDGSHTYDVVIRDLTESYIAIQCLSKEKAEVLLATIKENTLVYVS